jgi:PPP family 3-phenylpropionic acid transporter
MLSVGAGVVRWAVMVETAWLPALVAIEPMHGLTLALLHLTCMRLLAQCVTRHFEATALTLYGTVGLGAATALLTLAYGPIFERFRRTGSGQWRLSVPRRCRSLKSCASRWLVPG